MYACVCVFGVPESVGVFLFVFKLIVHFGLDWPRAYVRNRFELYQLCVEYMRTHKYCKTTIASLLCAQYAHALMRNGWWG